MCTSIICAYVSTCVCVYTQNNKTAKSEIWGFRAPPEVIWSTLLLEQDHHQPVAQDKVHNIFKKGDSTASLGSLVPVLNQPQTKKVVYCGILLTFRRSFLCFNWWLFPMALLLGITKNSLTSSWHGVPALYYKLLCSWVALSTYWCMEIFLPRYRTRQFPLLNLKVFLWAHSSSLLRFCCMAEPMAASSPILCYLQRFWGYILPHHPGHLNKKKV